MSMKGSLACLTLFVGLLTCGDEDYGGDEEEEEEYSFKVGEIVQYKEKRAEIIKEYEDGSYKIKLENFQIKLVHIRLK